MEANVLIGFLGYLALKNKVEEYRLQMAVSHRIVLSRWNNHI